MESGRRYERLEETDNLGAHEAATYRSRIIEPTPLESEDIPRRRRIRVDPKLCEDLTHLVNSLLTETRLGNAYLRGLCDYFGTRPARELIQREEVVEVEVHIAFLRIVDVNTKYGFFHAELFVQAKWKEPGLIGKTQLELEDLDFSRIWKPDIVLINAYGEPDDVKHWTAATASSDQGDMPILYTRTRARGQFKETLELQDFPIDIQDLTVIVSCERPVTEVKLVPDRMILPTVTVETFNDVNEFYLYEHVQVRNLEVDPHSIDKYSRSSRVAYTCSVARKPTYYFVNSILLQFLIAALVMLVYVEDPSEFGIRTSLSATLLLTSVAFKFTTSHDLPNVPYITNLEIYGIFCKIFLVVHVIENGVVFHLSKNENTKPLSTEVDRWCAVALGIIFILFNAIYLIIMARKYRINLGILTQKEASYRKEKKKRENNKYTTTTTAFGPFHMNSSNA